MIIVRSEPRAVLRRLSASEDIRIVVAVSSDVNLTTMRIFYRNLYSLIPARHGVLPTDIWSARFYVARRHDATWKTGGAAADGLNPRSAGDWRWIVLEVACDR